MRKRGYSFRGFWGQTKHFDNHGNLRGESYRNFWGGIDYFDVDMNRTGSSYRNFWGGSNYYDRREELESRSSHQEYPLAGVSYSDARINVDSEKAAFVDYGGSSNSSNNERTSKNQSSQQQAFENV